MGREGEKGWGGGIGKGERKKVGVKEEERKENGVGENGGERLIEWEKKGRRD